ncbi:hypothetical protein BaRGS_00036142 [Batillaria attramentaria]|uniref:Uncharacterized protein n=1 Tax=Batillaria attramentaria TaxID=370345 RepID=A0ABD0JCL2_9CAEN
MSSTRGTPRQEFLHEDTDSSSLLDHSALDINAQFSSAVSSLSSPCHQGRFPPPGQSHQQHKHAVSLCLPSKFTGLPGPRACTTKQLTQFSFPTHTACMSCSSRD